MNFLKSAALPWKPPSIEVGRRINAFCRSIATVAELAFALEGAIVLFVISRALGFPLGTLVARAVVVLITAAECFSWTLSRKGILG